MHNSNAVWFITYKLAEGKVQDDFLFAAEQCRERVLSRKKGYLSWKMLVDGDTYADLVTWETMEDAINAEKEGGDIDPAAANFYSFIDHSSLKMQCFSVAKD
jgi:hypothetical protein